ncbi:MAG: amidinotransferase [Terrimonas sp.]|nr:amidinotransferase [Terrimonas sp.]
MPTTSNILMIRPVHFGFNAETAVNNRFQVAGNNENTQEKALREFDDFVNTLRKNDISVMVAEDTPIPHTPDSLFPNNWISFHEDGSVVLYPMFAVNRRQERKEHVLEAIKTSFTIASITDLSLNEDKGVFLEGTGSMVLDRDHKIAYACLSARTDPGLLTAFCKKFGYQPFVFHATDENGDEIYHTNVMMCVADRYVVICLDAITDAKEKADIVKLISGSDKEIIEITQTQLNHFAGNMLQVENRQQEKLLVMSTQAYQSLNPAQIGQLTRYNPIVHAELSTIEKNGGGSARCMMAEIFLPRSKKAG